MSNIKYHLSSIIGRQADKLRKIIKINLQRRLLFTTFFRTFAPNCMKMESLQVIDRIKSVAAKVFFAGLNKHISNECITKAWCLWQDNSIKTHRNRSVRLDSCSPNSPKFQEQSRVEARMLTPMAWAFYSDMIVRCLAIPGERRRSKRSTFLFSVY